MRLFRVTLVRDCKVAGAQGTTPFQV
ncbi:MAG: hypothetical protein ACJA1E_002161 [Paracoccaceae bacterium]|jgi:hypothetical protein